MNRTRESYHQVAKKILKERYPDYSWAYVAGSIVRGEATDSSDIDLVVIFDKLPAAYRESFTAYGWPVEAFVHDLETIEYFFEEIDRKSARPSLPSMVAEGLIIPSETETAVSLQARAKLLLEEGPPALTAEEISSRRYLITDHINDLRTPRNPEEMFATLAKLYETLADFYLRTNRRWSAQGKAIPRALTKADAELALEYSDTFHRSIANGSGQDVIALAEKILEPYGGLFLLMVIGGTHRRTGDLFRDFDLRGNF